MIPAYLALSDRDFWEKIDRLYTFMKECKLCPHNCGVNRLKGEKGFCKVADKPYVSSYGAHFGEEPPITGYNGSGTIFFTHCNLKCIYCQNYTISQEGEGSEIEVEQLANIMLYLQSRGVHNINLVTPTHQIPFIVNAIFIARKEGLNIPIIYNCGGYESISVLEILNGIVDIYMPDFKYFDDVYAYKFSSAKNYVEIAKNALKEMHKQVGELLIVEGIAKRGLLVRHLILPENISGTDKFLDFIAKEISINTYINLMDQYYPFYKAKSYKELSRKITKEEFLWAINIAKSKGFKRVIY